MVKSQLNYCPLVWMFCPRRSSNLINKVQERALRITYNDQLTDFKSLLSNHNEITKHQRNLPVLPHESRRTVNYDLETICSRAPFLWANLPPENKLVNSLNIFKRKIKKCKGENCPCTS